MYVGRMGRIFIDKKIFHYQGSKWQNPYTVAKYGLDESLKKYKEHLEKPGWRQRILRDKTYYEGSDILMDDLHELYEYKELGCYCEECNKNSCLTEKCHAQVLVNLLK